MRVRVRLCLNACVSRRMRESWQLCLAERILIPHRYVLSKYPCKIDRDLRRQCQDVNKFEMQETNGIFVPRC